MLRAEALRLKKEELASCLRSRKRKLNELYFATVTFTPLEPNASDTVYEQNERLFLEANDLEKGRYFNESTLPPRPNVATHLFHRRPSAQQDVLRQKSIQSKGASTLGNDDHLESFPSTNASKSSTVVAHGQTESPVPAKSVIENEAPLESNGSLEERGGLSVEETKVKAPVNDVEASNGSASVDERSHIEKVVESPPGSPGIEPAQVEAEPVTFRTLASQTGTTVSMQPAAPIPPPAIDTILSRKRDDPALTPTLLPPPGEPNSSPASTNGLDSASTPQPPVVSPTTSPGDEEPGESSQIASLDRSHSPQTKCREGPVNNSVDPDKSTTEAQTPISNTLLQPKARDALSNTTVNQGSRKSPLPPGIAALGVHTPLIPGRALQRRPPMHIDTTSASPSGFVESPAEMTGRNTVGFTPCRPPPMPVAYSPPERMTTRVSSGAIRHKSVSEILGEVPKPASPQNEKASSEYARAGSMPEPDAGKDASRPWAAQQPADRREREKERARLSTVLFPKSQVTTEPDAIELRRRITNEATLPHRQERDYLYTLFEAKASQNRGITLGSLLASANKSVSTADWMVDYKENKNCRTLKRIYQLQNANRWPLRQMERSAEPPRQTSHWDFILDHVKWLRTDFREERKWKLAAARALADWCAEFVASDSEKRKTMQIKVKRSRLMSRSEQKENALDKASSPMESTPDLIPSAEDDSASDGLEEDHRSSRLLQAPAAIFSLGPSEFNFALEKTPAADKLLEELPLYQPTNVESDLAQSDLAERRDAAWKRNLLPISKFASSKIHLLSSKPPRKKSRYEYEEDLRPQKGSPLPAEHAEVALFMPENKHIRDRIHPGHSFRPPAEHPMPSQGFYESRWSSTWTSVEDDELRRLVKDYSYNWSLISGCLSTKSMHHPAADRRTPWECFERWIGLEGLPADMSKTPYFRAYHARIESAGRLVAAQQQAAQQQAGAPMQIRRKTTLPMRVERKRNTRYLAFVDAFRKLAKKREVAAQKQQHAAGLAAMRKATEASQPKPPISTPQQFSNLKHEREQKLAERQELYRQQVLAHQKAALQQRSSMQNSSSATLRGASTSSANGTAPLSAAAVVAASSQGLPNSQYPSAQAQQSRNLSMAQGMTNGHQSNGNVPNNLAGMKGIAQGQMPANLGINRPQMHSPENMRVLMEANRLQEQQRLAAAARQQLAQQPGQQGQHRPQNSPPSQMSTINGTNTNQNAAMFAAVQANNGTSSPAINTNGQGSVIPTGTSTSPRMSAGGQALSSGMMPHIHRIMQHIAQRQPDLSPEEVKRLATQQLVQQHQHQRSMNQAALNAAAGAASTTGMYGMGLGNTQHGIMTNEQVQQYNLLRQRAPMSNGSPSMSMARPVSGHGQGQNRSATPQTQRSDSQSLAQLNGQNGQNGQSRSPTISQQQMPT